MFLSVSQVAERLQMSKKTIFRRIQSGELPHYRIGAKTIRISEKDLNEYIDNSKQAI